MEMAPVPVEAQSHTAEDIPGLAEVVLRSPAFCYPYTLADMNQLLDATTAFRKILSMERSPPIAAVIASGVVRRFVEMLSADTHPRLQFEACWALTNIAYGTSSDTQTVIAAGAVPAFVKLLSSPSEDVREQAVWALGNIAGDSVSTRDLVIDAGTIAPLIARIWPHAKDTFIRNATWTISNLVRGKPLPDFAAVAPLLPVLASLVTSDDKETLADALQSLSYLSDGEEGRLQAFLETGCLGRVVKLLEHPSPKVLMPALRTVSNIVKGDDLQTQAALNEGVLLPMAKLLSFPRKCIRKEACLLVSNVCAGTMSQIQAVMDANLIAPLVALVVRGEPEVSKEACWALCNATARGSSEQIATLVLTGIIPSLKYMLGRTDQCIQHVVIAGLKNILRHRPPAGFESYLVHMEEAGVPAALEDLMSAETTTTSAWTKADAFMQAHFPHYSHFAGREEEDDPGNDITVEAPLDDAEGDNDLLLPLMFKRSCSVAGCASASPQLQVYSPPELASSGSAVAQPAMSDFN